MLVIIVYVKPITITIVDLVYNVYLVLLHHKIVLLVLVQQVFGNLVTLALVLLVNICQVIVVKIVPLALIAIKVMLLVPPVLMASIAALVRLLVLPASQVIIALVVYKLHVAKEHIIQELVRRKLQLVLNVVLEHTQQLLEQLHHLLVLLVPMVNIAVLVQLLAQHVSQAIIALVVYKLHVVRELTSQVPVLH